MKELLVAENLTKRFGDQTALESLSFSLPAGSIVGLVGRNGAGKTTLLNVAAGVLLPSSGTCRTLGRDSTRLESEELAQLGLTPQEGKLVEWMTVEQHLQFNASFYPRWDQARQARLIKELELDPRRKLAQLSTGDRQKVSILLGVCHHPALLLLDEPVSALDPIARAQMLRFLVDVIRDDGATIVISSHILSDVEKIIDWVLCLDGGRLATNLSLDDLQESYAEWIITSPAGCLPPRFAENFVLSCQGDAHRARLHVRGRSAQDAAAFAAVHRAEIEVRPLTLEETFPLLVNHRGAAS